MFLCLYSEENTRGFYNEQDSFLLGGVNVTLNNRIIFGVEYNRNLRKLPNMIDGLKLHLQSLNLSAGVLF